ncbi:hypothetical protein JCM16303_003913 [Sporobolomyces ruberrimus]
MIEPSTRRPTTNPFRRDGAPGKLMKRVSRTLSGSGGPSGRSTTSLPSPRSCDTPTLPPVLAPLSPTLSVPPLSPCPSYRSSDSASFRSISRKPIAEVDLSFLSSSTSRSYSSEVSDSYDTRVEEDHGEVDGKGAIVEVVDGLWTSTCDERIDWPLPLWYTTNHTSPTLPSQSQRSSSKNNRIGRLASYGLAKAPKPKPRRNFTTSPIPELELPWLPSSLPSPSLESYDSHPGFVRIDIDPTSPTFSTCSSESFASSSTSSSASVASPREPATRVSSPLPQSSAPDRKSLLRIEAGGRQLIFNSSFGGERGFIKANQFEEDDDDEEEILVIRLPPS